MNALGLRASALGTIGLVVVSAANGQMAGNSVYGRQQYQIQNQSGQDLLPTLNSVFIEAKVLMNVPADQYVAVFGIGEEGKNLEEARQKVGEKLVQFRERVRVWNSRRTLHTDFVAQNRIYGWEAQDRVAVEKLQGFEVKANVAVPCASSGEVEELLAVAAASGIYDLVKVDYVVTDIDKVNGRLMAEASKIVHRKLARYESLFNVKVSGSPQPYLEKFDAAYPTDAYSNYQASEGETFTPGFRTDRYDAVQGARKMRTFYYNPSIGKGYDEVVGQVATDPVVQFSLDLKLRYEKSGSSASIKRAGSKHQLRSS